MSRQCLHEGLYRVLAFWTMTLDNLTTIMSEVIEKIDSQPLEHYSSDSRCEEQPKTKSRPARLSSHLLHFWPIPSPSPPTGNKLNNSLIFLKPFPEMAKGCFHERSRFSNLKPFDIVWFVEDIISRGLWPMQGIDKVFPRRMESCVH